MSTHGGFRAKGSLSGDDSSYLHGGNGDVVKGGTAMMEVLTEMQRLLDANEKLQTALQLNSTVMEQKVAHVQKLKDDLEAKKDELTDLKQRYGDTRVSVLGFKARIMKLTGELKQHRDPNAISSIQELEKQLKQMTFEKEESCTRISSLEDQLQLYSTDTQSWSMCSENLAKEKDQMQASYIQLLREKDAEIVQLKQLIESKKRDLIEKQGTIDSLHHRPVPKPRPRTSAELQDTKRQLAELQETLSKERKHRETGEQRTRELRTKLETLSIGASISKGSKADEEIARLSAEISQLKEQNDNLKYETQSNVQKKEQELSQLRSNYDRVVREGETAERRLQRELKEANDALRLQSESEWRSKEANDAMQRLQSSEQELRDAKERLKEANDAMQRLQSSEQELRDAKERSEHENTRLRREAEWRLKEANDAMQRLQSSEQELREAKERSERENARLRREAEQARPKDEGTGQNRHAKTRRLTEEKQRALDQLAALKSENMTIRDDLGMKVRELTGIKQEYESFRSQSVEERSQMEYQLELNQAEIQKMESTYEELSGKLNDARSQLTALTHAGTNKDEHIHTLEQRLADAENNLRKKDKSRQNWTDVMSEMRAEIIALKEQQLEINKEKMHFQSLVTQLQQEVSYLKQELRKSKDRVEKKQQDCQEHLNTSKAWRAQFEQAKKDFDEERRQRENDAQAVAMFKKKSKQMEEDITQLHQKSNVLEQHIATLEVALQDNNIPVPFIPGDNTFTGELHRVPRLNPDPQGSDGRGMDHNWAGGPGRGVDHNWAGGPGGGPIDHNWAGSPGGGGGGPMDWQSGKGMEWQDGHGGRMGYTDRDRQFQQPPPMDYGGQPTRTEPHPMRSDVPRSNNQLYAATQVHPQLQQREFIAPGEVQNLAKPAMNCPICGREDFNTQTELEVHSAQCT